ncbi:MAG TPA: glycosyl transferase, partial [Pseudomonas sp.]|nr:glycosyl transferase [Pseudomonas sp.]
MSGHWAQQRERGSPVLMRLTAWLARHLGRRAIAPLLRLI